LVKGKTNSSPVLLDLNEYSDKELDEMGWFSINPDTAYNSVERWFYSENK